MPKILSFEEAISASDEKRKILLGNGFSRACRNNNFAYDALFDRADFSGLSPQVRESFSVLDTTDFEVVMRSLQNASLLIRTYSPDSVSLAQTMEADAGGLRDVLVRAIAGSHPASPGEISDESYTACRHFLAHFPCIYTLNYDLLLYWALMHSDAGPTITHDDGFRTPDSGRQEYVTWDIDKTNHQNVFYMHGALHIFDAGSELVKYTWVNTGIRLIDQIRDALTRNLYPLFVAEGNSSSKYEKIRHSDFLSRAYRSFANISGTLFIFGHSFAENDEHILRLIERGKISTLFVGVFGDPESTDNLQIVRRAEQMRDNRPKKKPLTVFFYDAASAKPWG